MKYGLLTYFGSKYCNFGDYVQSIAIEYLLVSEMGISQSDIIYLTEDDLKTYDGEDLLLPYSYVLSFLMDASDGIAKVSDKIHIVFLGASVEFATLFNAYPIDNFFKEDRGYLPLFKKFSPIGCRDNATKELLQSHGINAYLQGCITNILPQRKEGEYRKILLIDVPEEIKDHIPPDRLQDIEVISNADDIGDMSYSENYQRIKDRYEYYKNNAALIISSRYHIVTPCNALGIPCIFIKRVIDKHIKDIRLDTLHPNIQIIENNEFYKIDFSKKLTVTEKDILLKENIKQLAVSRIISAQTIIENTSRIYRFFEPRIKWFEEMPASISSYQSILNKYISKKYPQGKHNYYIWGAIKLLCDGDEVIIEKMVKEINPELQFVGWIDSFKSGTLANTPIFSPLDVKLDKDDFIIIAAETAVNAVKKWMYCNNYDQSQSLTLVNTMITQEDVNLLLSKN